MYPLTCLLLLALPVCLDQIVQGEDQSPRDAALAINKAERQIELGLLKKAADLLQFYLQRLAAPSSRSGSECCAAAGEVNEACLAQPVLLVGKDTGAPLGNR